MPIDFRQRVPSQVAATSADPFRRALDFYPASAARRAGFLSFWRSGLFRFLNSGYELLAE
jgi:hypothetical protein